MTEPIEFKNEVDVPPIIMDDMQYPNGSIITFERVQGQVPKELRISLHVRDENLTQELKVRQRVTRPVSGLLLYECPELPLPTGTLDRPLELVIPQNDLDPGRCNKIEIAVSGHFSDCRTKPEVADDLFSTVQLGHESDLARATYWVWEIGNNVLGDPEAAQELARSCKVEEYEPQSSTTPTAE